MTEALEPSQFPGCGDLSGFQSAAPFAGDAHRPDQGAVRDRRRRHRLISRCDQGGALTVFKADRNCDLDEFAALRRARTRVGPAGFCKNSQPDDGGAQNYLAERGPNPDFSAITHPPGRPDKCYRSVKHQGVQNGRADPWQCSHLALISVNAC